MSPPIYCNLLGAKRKWQSPTVSYYFSLQFLAESPARNVEKKGNKRKKNTHPSNREHGTGASLRLLSHQLVQIISKATSWDQQLFGLISSRILPWLLGAVVSGSNFSHPVVFHPILLPCNSVGSLEPAHLSCLPRGGLFATSHAPFSTCGWEGPFLGWSTVILSCTNPSFSP